MLYMGLLRNGNIFIGPVLFARLCWIIIEEIWVLKVDGTETNKLYRIEAQKV